MGDRVVATERLAELQDQMERQSRVLAESRRADAGRIDAVRQLRILTNALELICRQAG